MRHFIAVVFDNYSWRDSHIESTFLYQGEESSSKMESKTLMIFAVFMFSQLLVEGEF